MSKRAGMGFMPSAEEVLKRAGKPLTCREIVDRASKLGLLVSNGKTPEKTLNALLQRKLKVKRSTCAIRKVGPGLFELKK